MVVEEEGQAAPGEDHLSFWVLNGYNSICERSGTFEGDAMNSLLAQLDPPTFGMVDVSFPGQLCPTLVQARLRGTPARART